MVCSSSRLLPISLLLPRRPTGLAEVLLTVAVIFDEVCVGNAVPAIDYGLVTGWVQHQSNFGRAARGASRRHCGLRDVGFRVDDREVLWKRMIGLVERLE